MFFFWQVYFKYPSTFFDIYLNRVESYFLLVLNFESFIFVFVFSDICFPGVYYLCLSHELRSVCLPLDGNVFHLSNNSPSLVCPITSNLSVYLNPCCQTFLSDPCFFCFLLFLVFWTPGLIWDFFVDLWDWTDGLVLIPVCLLNCKFVLSFHTLRDPTSCPTPLDLFARDNLTTLGCVLCPCLE